LESCCAKPTALTVLREVDNHQDIWRPVIAGLCTEEEALHATAYRLAILNRVADLKLEARGEDNA
jgi:hypothetical protein